MDIAFRLVENGNFIFLVTYRLKCTVFKSVVYVDSSFSLVILFQSL